MLSFARRCYLPAILSLGVAMGPQVASASIEENGTFDTDLSGWTITGDTTTGVTWTAGTAHVGRPGTPGLAEFEQTLDIPAGSKLLSISFDYEWQVNPPELEDFFDVEFSYTSTTGPVVSTLLSEGSTTGAFGSTTSFSTLLPLTDLADPPSNGKILFTLNENNETAGTRIQLDNVSIRAVPEATAFVTWSTLLGLSVAARRRRRDA